MNSSPSKTKQFLTSVILLCLILLNAFLSQAQSTDTIIPVRENPEKLLRNIRIGHAQRTGEPIWRDKFSGHLAGVDFGFNMFLNEDYSGYESDFMKNDVLHSNSVYVNFVDQSIGLQRVRNTIGLVTGIGLRLYNYRLDKYTTIKRDENSVIQPVEINLQNIKKSNLAIMALQVPLLAEFQIPVNHFDNRIYFSAGMYGGVKLTSHTKVKYKLERNEKLKVVDHFSIRDFNYGLMVRTGYRWVNLFATYDLVPFFRENRGPELTPFTFGITLISF
jgi:hypothetical protein